MPATYTSRSPAPRATVHVEYEAGQYVGFAVDGGRVRRVIETRDRIEARRTAEAEVARINRQRPEISA